MYTRVSCALYRVDSRTLYVMDHLMYVPIAMQSEAGMTGRYRNDTVMQ